MMIAACEGLESARGLEQRAEPHNKSAPIEDWDRSARWRAGLAERAKTNNKLTDMKQTLRARRETAPT